MALGDDNNPGNNNNNTPGTPNTTTRRSARVHKRDPIVAPGFGTQNDLAKLSENLGLPLEAVKAVMESRGRGIRSSRRKEDAAQQQEQVPPTPISTAWADFMKEEGVVDTTTANTGGSTAANEAAASSSAVAAAIDAQADDDKAPAGKKESSSQDTRVYDLPLKPSWSKGDDDDERAAKRPKISSSAGVLVQTGTLDSTTIGRNKRTMDEDYDLMVPTVLNPKLVITKVISGCNAAHAIALTEDGQAYGWGRNEASQLGGDLEREVPLPTLLEGVSNIVDGAVGKSHTILLDSSNQLWAVGNNKCGQCSIRNFAETVPNFRKCVLPPSVNIVQIACGEHFSVALSDQGHLYTTGSSEFGQLGNGETGEYFVTASKLAFANCNVFTRRSVFCHAPGEKTYGSSSTDVKVVPLSEDVRLSHVACGKHHTIAVEAPSTGNNRAQRVFTFGCGDYGCLGHGVQKDEYFPRLVASLANNPGVFPVSSSAGAHCSMALTNHGHVYYWGKHRSVGEATMRPSLLEALANNGHVVTHCGGGAQTVVCCTQNAVTVSWGQGPHGELGYGEKKSSSKPDFVASLDKCRVADLACGYGFTLFVLKSEDKDDKAAISKLPIVQDADVEALLKKYGR